MKRSLSLCLALFIAAGLCVLPGQVSARSNSSLSHIQVTYHGGPLLQHVRVATLFWGSDWQGNDLTGYFSNFFRALFADGRFMANLAQYSAGGYQIGNGTFVGSDSDTQGPPATVTDAQIRAEIQAQIAAGALPKPDPDTIYFVFTPSQVVVVDPSGVKSVNHFTAYHTFDSGGDGFAYAVVPYADTLQDPHVMTAFASHELAEAVTDPEPGNRTLSWYDLQNGEIGDIPVSLFAAGIIAQSDLLDELDGSDGSIYEVQKEWSNNDNGPVAFAPVGGG